LEGDRTSSARAAVLGLSLAGMGLAILPLYLHHKLRATGGAYTSFCNIGSGFNCDAVLTSPYSELLGFPVELWGLLTYATIVGTTLRCGGGTRRSKASPTPFRVLLFLCTWAAAFSVYMAAVATFLVGSFCINCVALYLVNFGLAAAAWIWARRAGMVGRRASAPIGRQQILLGAVCIAIFLFAGGWLQLRTTSGFYGYLTDEEVKEQAPDFYRWYLDQPLVSDIPAGRHYKGPSSAAVRIVEFSDFECGHCRKASHDLSRLLARYLGEVRLEFRHFPLDEKCNSQVTEPFHRAACALAVASECAGEQGKFWEYHDLLFSGRQPVGQESLVGLAVDLGLDRERFFKCLNNAEVLARVSADIELGKRLNVKSTPTILINGRLVVGALETAGYEYAVAIERNRRPRE